MSSSYLEIDIFVLLSVAASCVVLLASTALLSYAKSKELTNHDNIADAKFPNRYVHRRSRIPIPRRIIQ